jgi:hypothetical protein
MKALKSKLLLLCIILCASSIKAQYHKSSRKNKAYSLDKIPVLTISQKRNDLIDYNNVNLDLLNSLVIEKAAHVRDSLNKSKAFYDETLSKVTKFQNDYLSTYDIMSHGNTLKIKNKSLNSLGDRLDFFNPKRKYISYMEILVCLPYMPYRTNLTYDYVSSSMIEAYMSSPGHRYALITDGDSETPLKISINFKTSLSPKSKKLYNTGVILVE